MNKEGIRLKTWKSMASTTQESRLPIDDVAVTAVTGFPGRKVRWKSSKLAQVMPREEELYVKARDEVRKMM